MLDKLLRIGLWVGGLHARFLGLSSCYSKRGFASACARGWVLHVVPIWQPSRCTAPNLSCRFESVQSCLRPHCCRSGIAAGSEVHRHAPAAGHERDSGVAGAGEAEEGAALQTKERPP